MHGDDDATFLFEPLPDACQALPVGNRSSDLGPKGAKLAGFRRRLFPAPLCGGGAGFRRSYQVLNATGALLSNVQDAETGQRGYLLTGEESYREPFQSALGEQLAIRRTLRQLTAGNAAQQAILKTVDRLVEAKFSELQQTMELRRTAGLDAALAVVRTGAGMRRLRLRWLDGEDGYESPLRAPVRDSGYPAHTRVGLLGLPRQQQSFESPVRL